MAMTDKRLQERAVRYKDIDAKIKKLEAQKTKIKDQIISEMERRGLRGVEGDDAKITLVQPTYVEYDLEGIREDLGPKRFQLITVPVLDKDKLAEAVQAGKVNLNKVERHATVKDKKPYINVSLRG